MSGGRRGNRKYHGFLRVVQGKIRIGSIKTTQFLTIKTESEESQKVYFSK